MARFKSRSASRDRDADLERIAALRAACDHAGAQIDAELSGLRRRYAEAAAKAADSLGNEVYPDGRDPADEALLVEQEAQMSQATLRITVLDDQRRRLSEIGELIRALPVSPAQDPV